MSSVSVMPREVEWTVKDLEALPDDGLQDELLDGILLVSPGPVGRHQRACARLHLVLAAACPPELKGVLRAGRLAAGRSDFVAAGSAGDRGR